MAELLTRFTRMDVPVLQRVTAPAARGRAGLSRVVVGALAGQMPQFAQVARQVGLPLLVDPETFYLQGRQHAADQWAQLPFATANVVMVGDLMNLVAIDRLVARVVDHQLACGATVIIPPYVHIEKAADGWADVQTILYRRTRRYLDANGIDLPVTAVLAISWSLAGRVAWPAVVDRLLTAIDDLAPNDVALAVSKVDQGVHPHQRLGAFHALIRHISRRGYPVLAWNQGLLGESAVVAGAAGYETGIGWGERGDLRSRMNQHRKEPDPDGGFGARPTYISALGRSLRPKTVQTLLSDPVVGPELVCMDPACCRNGRAALRGDTRVHAILARATRLTALEQTSHPRWAWSLLLDRAEKGLTLAERINALAERHSDITRVDTGALTAIALTAKARREKKKIHAA